MPMSRSQLKLLDLELAARSYPGESLKPALSTEIDGHMFVVAYHTTNRQCFDNLPTPTIQIKVDGKRITRKTAYDMLRD